MRSAYLIALAFLLAASSLPAFAAEPDAPQVLINRNEAIRIAVQNRLSATFPKTTEHKKDERGALVEHYSVPDQPLLWVNEKGLTERAKAVMAEIARADEYGLRASDYMLPKADGFNASDAKAIDWLADAEIEISYAVLDYVNDARGGRIDPERLSPNLDPQLVLPNPSEVIDAIEIRSDPAAYLRSFHPNQPQFEALRQKLIELRGGKAERAAPVVQIPEGPVLKLGVENEQVAFLRKRLDVPAERGASASMFDEDVLEAVKRFQLAHGAVPDGLVGPATRRMLNNQPRLASGPGIDAILVNMERWRWLPHDLG